jgi:hypothetical protein
MQAAGINPFTTGTKASKMDKKIRFKAQKREPEIK